MIVSTSHAEDELRTALASLSPSGADTYHLIRLQKAGHSYGSPWDIVLLQTVVNHVHKLLAEAVGVQAFFCHDGELLILLKDISDNVLTKLLHTLKDVFGNSEASLQELSEHYDAISAECEKKYQKWHAHQEQGSVRRREDNLKVKIDKKYAKELLEKRQGREGIHILLVEDEPFTLKLIEGVLSEYTIIKAMTGPEAVEAYMLNAPDMVFLDINLPGMDGHKVLEQILAFDEDCYVVMLSGNTLMKDVSYSLSKGAKGFVVKPFPKEKLLNYVGLCKAIKEEKNLMNEAV